MIKKIILLGLFICCGVAYSDAQLGISGTYNFFPSSVLKEPFTTEQADAFLFDNTIGFGIDYKLRPLKDYRFEVIPSLHYMKTQAGETISGLDSRFVETDLTNISVSFGLRIYPLDMEGDCDCPTWGKDGSLIKKGFYLQGAFGLTYNHYSWAEEIGALANLDDSFSVLLGIGAGLDIGLSDYLTLTPFANYLYHLNHDWSVIQTVEFPLPHKVGLPVDDSLSHFQVGLRLGLHLKK